MIFNLVAGAATSAKGFPEFTYSGQYSLIDDGKDGDTQNWRIKLLTSGVVNFKSLGTGAGGIEVFCVGGGGGGGTSGGGGGYTTTSDVIIAPNTDYPIVVGAGGAGVALNQASISGGQSSAFGITADGGQGGGIATNGGSGGAGGSGGGGYRGGTDKTGNGGTNGGDGEAGNVAAGGKGQGSSTYEFGASSGTLYSGGGGAAYKSGGGYGGSGGGGRGANTENYNAEAGTSGTVNTGGGGGGYAWTTLISGAGGSGIVVIRNKR